MFSVRKLCTYICRRFGCEQFRLKGIRLNSGTVPAAVSRKKYVVIHATVSPKSKWEGNNEETSQKTCQPSKMINELRG